MQEVSTSLRLKPSATVIDAIENNRLHKLHPNIPVPGEGDLEHLGVILPYLYFAWNHNDIPLDMIFDFSDADPNKIKKVDYNGGTLTVPVAGLHSISLDFEGVDLSYKNLSYMKMSTIDQVTRSFGSTAVIFDLGHANLDGASLYEAEYPEGMLSLDQLKRAKDSLFMVLPWFLRVNESTLGLPDNPQMMCDLLLSEHDIFEYNAIKLVNHMVLGDDHPPYSVALGHYVAKTPHTGDFGAIREGMQSTLNTLYGYKESGDRADESYRAKLHCLIKVRELVGHNITLMAKSINHLDETKGWQAASEKLTAFSIEDCVSRPHEVINDVPELGILEVELSAALEHIKQITQQQGAQMSDDTPTPTSPIPAGKPGGDEFASRPSADISGPNQPRPYSTRVPTTQRAAEPTHQEPGNKTPPQTNNSWVGKEEGNPNKSRTPSGPRQMS